LLVFLCLFMKPQMKLIGVDDGSFHFGEKTTIIIGTIMRANGYIEGVLKREIQIDGSDSTDVLIDMIVHTYHRKQLQAILLDGASVGGFNIIDIERIFQETQLPVMTISRDSPNFEDIKKALRAHFSDWDVRYNLLKKGDLYHIKTKYNPIYLKCVGLGLEKAKEIITLSTIQGVIPEPLRVAHLIASGITSGESYGKT